jgi:RecA/RadA recombinase
MSKLKERILKLNTLVNTSILSESKLANKTYTKTKYPMINVALSGKLDGGMTPGILVIGAPSRNFKTGFSLMMAKEFQEQHPEGIVVYYDTEGGAPYNYFESLELDTERVIHKQVPTIEELMVDMNQILDSLEDGEKVFFILDSIGNIGTRIEVEKLKEEKFTADMGKRQQVIKAFFRSIQLKILQKDVSFIVISHTYQEMSLFPKEIVAGGTGQMYAANDVWRISKKEFKDKTTHEVTGNSFTIIVEKSRTCRSGVRIPVTVTMGDKPEKYSGLYEVAMRGEFIIKPKQGWYALKNNEEKLYREKDIKFNSEVWEILLADPEFIQYVEGTHKLGSEGEIDDKTSDL